MDYRSGADPRGEMDAIAEYRSLKQKAEAAAHEVVRAEERVEAAKKAASEVAARAREMGFESVDQVTARRVELEEELAEAIKKLKEAVE